MKIYLKLTIIIIFKNTNEVNSLLYIIYYYVKNYCWSFIKRPIPFSRIRWSDYQSSTNKSRTITTLLCPKKRSSYETARVEISTAPLEWEFTQSSQIFSTLHAHL